MDQAVKSIYLYLLKYGGRVRRVKGIGNNGYAIELETEEFQRYTKSTYWASVGTMILVPGGSQVIIDDGEVQ